MHELVLQYRDRQQLIQKRLRELRRTTAETIFYELCFCLLTPGSRAHSCWDAVLRLRAHHFYRTSLRPTPHLRGVRFHNNKTRYLLEMKPQFSVFQDVRQHCSDPFMLREWLVAHMNGLGMKEASHFLRNIGYRGLAILDRHILTNLLRWKVLSRLPKTLTKKRYLAIEQTFLQFSEKIEIPIDHLDLLFWSSQTGEVFK